MATGAVAYYIKGVMLQVADKPYHIKLYQVPINLYGGN